MVKLEDTYALGAYDRKVVGVQIPPPAPKMPPPVEKIFDTLKIPKKPTLKTYIFAELVILYLLALFYTPFYAVWQQTVLALTTATTLEIILNKLRKQIYYFPDSAIITALIIAMVLPQNLPPYVAIAASATAILAKHFVRINNRHIFNPANLGVVLAAYLFGTFSEWWGASNLLILIVAGFYIIGAKSKLNRIYLPAIFLIIYVILGSILQGQSVADRLTANLGLWFFAFIMLPEPQTSPIKTATIALFGTITAIFTVIFETLTFKAPLNLALFFANLTVPVLNYLTIGTRSRIFEIK